MSVNNIVGRNIETETSVIEATIETKLDKIKADHVKTIYSFDMNLSALTKTILFIL